MSVMLQIRNVPDPLHRELKARAALAGMTLSQYALTELRKSLSKPPRGDVLARIATRRSVRPRTDSATLLRRERGRR